MAAFRTAVSSGADGVECDVAVTSDGVPVIMHDDSLLRIAGVDRLVSECTAEFVTNLVATKHGNWEHSEWKDEKIPTLFDFLSFAVEVQTIALVDLKDSLNSDDIAEIVKVVLNVPLLELDKIFFISRSERLLKELKDQLPQSRVLLTLMLLPGDLDMLFQKLKSYGFYGVDIATEISECDVSKFIEAGFDVWTCVVDDLEKAFHYATIGCCGITSNYASLIKDGLGTLLESWNKVLKISSSNDNSGIVGGGLGIVKYDTTDYITNGLVAHYDAIRNCGHGVPHDDSAKEWIDLCGHNFARFMSTGGERYPDEGWTSNGIVLGAGMFAHMVNEIFIGKNMTVQLVAEIDSAQQLSPFAAMFSDSRDAGIFYRRENGENTKRIEWKTDGYGSFSYDVCQTLAFRPVLEWDGKYMTAMIDDIGMYLFQTKIPENCFARQVVRDIGANRWNIGASSFGPFEHRAYGTYHAVRIYNRSLLDEELKWNRCVDDIRFFGAPIPVTNVVVESSIAGVNTQISNGVYTVNGPYLFTAVFGGKDSQNRSYVCDGSEISWRNPIDGSWSQPIESNATHFMYPGSGTIKIKWLWKLRCSAFIIR